MLQKVIGSKSNVFAVEKLIATLETMELEGTLYIGYPILSSFDDTIIIDALLTTLEHGVVAFDFVSRLDGDADREHIKRKQDDVYTAIEQRFKSFRELRSGRSLPFEIHVVGLLPDSSDIFVRQPDLIIVDPERLPQIFPDFQSITLELLRQVNAAVQRVATIKPRRKRSNVQREGSRGAIIKQIEAEIANLDAWQKQAAIEFPDGPQSIRGLAGSGKTIVLALKAAYLHALHPEWKIAITFQTRSLYQQFEDLIRRFTFEHLNDEPDWERLQIIHAWGSSSQPGVYSQIAQEQHVGPKDFLYGKNKYGYDKAFDGVCQELLEKIPEDEFHPLYDAILIDEAQDFPRSFFQLVYLATKHPKRIIYAYDELQNLGAFSMAPPAELFGTDKDGRPRIEALINQEGAPKQDIILPVCYRNTPWALTIAHALGFGIYRDDGLVQFFNDVDLWDDIGYEVVSGSLELGQDVVLRRRRDAYPAYFNELLDPGDAVVCSVFEDQESQAEQLAALVETNLAEDELEYQDILIILANPLTAQKDAAPVIRALNNRNIPAHLAGVTSSRDELFNDESVAVSGIYRAKGNEAPMVYIVNAGYGYGGYELAKRRNILFTAITRSKGWVRLFGCGPSMEALQAEVESVVKKEYELHFRVPTEDELNRMQRIHRDRTKQEKADLIRMERNLLRLLKMIEEGELALDSLPLELRTQLETLFGGQNTDGS